MRNSSHDKGHEEGGSAYAKAGYPKEYRLDAVSDVQAYRQCGNSVVVPLITAVAHNLIKAVGLLNI